MNKNQILAAGAVLLLLVGLGSFRFFRSPSGTSNTAPLPALFDVKNMSYVVGSETFKLVDGVATKEYAPGSAIKNKLRLFGDPVYGDLDGDGDTDAAVLLQNEPGGSGTFYYAALVINNGGSTYTPTKAMLLGDRIAPQVIEIRDGRAGYFFAERRANEPMSTPPSWGRSVLVHYDKKTGDIGEWVKGFEGESNLPK